MGLLCAGLASTGGILSVYTAFFSFSSINYQSLQLPVQN